ncbi:MAG: hypothetical protein ACQEQM_01010 [Thermoplasmatota archaeon]
MINSDIDERMNEINEFKLMLKINKEPSKLKPIMYHMTEFNRTKKAPTNDMAKEYFRKELEMPITVIPKNIMLVKTRPY